MDVTNGSTQYLATYSAYDGKLVWPQLLETSNFLRCKCTCSMDQRFRTKVSRCFPGRSTGTMPCSPVRMAEIFLSWIPTCSTSGT
jgi:hypothetical protein